VRTGTWIPSGVYTFAALMFATAFQVFFITKRKMSLFLGVLVLAAVAFFVSGSWIQNPIVPREYGYGTGYCIVLYGAYITLVSTVAASTTSFLYLATTVERQLGLNKPKQLKS
jgi:hypothetical protein